MFVLIRNYGLLRNIFMGLFLLNIFDFECLIFGFVNMSWFIIIMMYY